MASPANQRCASCIGTLLLPVRCGGALACARRRNGVTFVPYDRDVFVFEETALGRPDI